MTGISQLLGIGASALRVNQLGLAVTGKNIANVNTEGYSRQRLSIANATPSGVYAVSVDRVFNQFINANLVSEKQELGKWEGLEEALGLVEGIFTETEDSGISAALDDFWGAWEDLANNPSGYAERSALAAKTETLTGMIQDTYGQLETMETTLNDDIDNSVTEVNQLATQIADLNDQIRRAEASGQETADLLDSRDQLLSDLAGHVDFTTETQDGMVNIKLANAADVGVDVYLVEGTTANTLAFDGTDLSVGGTVITGEIEGGRISGMLSAKENVADYKDRLDTLAATLITQVNDLHEDGYGLDGSQTDFFQGTGASDIALHDDLAADVNKIAASASGDTGDNTVALAIAELANTDVLGDQSFGEYYSSLVEDVGSALSQAQTFSKHQSAIVAELETQKESVSGVSLDEETVNLIKYQNGYEAAAKLITVADEILQTLMDMV